MPASFDRDFKSWGDATRTALVRAERFDAKGEPR